MTENDSHRSSSEASNRHQALKARFAYANAAAGIVSALVGVLANFAFGRLDDLRTIGGTGVAFVSQLHWLILFTLAIMLYALGCFLISMYHPHPNGPLRSIFRVPSWVELRNFGNQRIAKASYFALGILPVAIWFVSDNPLKTSWLKDISIPLNIKISFFISFFVALALLIFTVGCPKDFLRKNVFAGTKNVNLVFGSADRAVVQVAQNEDDFYDEALDFSKLELRAACWLFYLLGLSLSTVLLFRSAHMVLYS
ncbi:hypothetical protein KQX62_14885 [Rhodopseudomonas palustris]|uniref:Uncharacterized protein n=1 Tax=Rhodopseudomonas palustris TaxID=1076 RepID=A0AAX3DT60_RHOPL|nr:hypothetical protein [Rhodopseudomonas palustris]UYO38023.1 hypothetical protein KQX62_14885 [Rhodopseudomonas palustris]